MHRFIQFAFKVGFGVFSQESRIHQDWFFFSPLCFCRDVRLKFWTIYNQTWTEKSKTSHCTDAFIHLFAYFFFSTRLGLKFFPKNWGFTKIFFSVLYVPSETLGGNFEQCLVKHRLQKSDLSLDRCFNSYVWFFFHQIRTQHFGPMTSSNSFVAVAWKSEGCFKEHKRKAKMVLGRKIATVHGKKRSIQDIFEKCKIAAEKKGFKIFGIRVSEKDFFNCA